MSTEAVIEKKPKIKDSAQLPGLYKVVVFNDDVTHADFVCLMLVRVFKHSEDRALDLTNQIHNEGSAVAGVYSFEVAEQRSIDATTMARASGYPLVIKVIPE